MPPPLCPARRLAHQVQVADLDPGRVVHVDSRAGRGDRGRPGTVRADDQRAGRVARVPGADGQLAMELATALKQEPVARPERDPADVTQGAPGRRGRSSRRGVFARRADVIGRPGRASGRRSRRCDEELQQRAASGGQADQDQHEDHRDGSPAEPDPVAAACPRRTSHHLMQALPRPSTAPSIRRPATGSAAARCGRQAPAAPARPSAARPDRSPGSRSTRSGAGRDRLSRRPSPAVSVYSISGWA